MYTYDLPYVISRILSPPFEENRMDVMVKVRLYELRGPNGTVIKGTLLNGHKIGDKIFLNKPKGD